MKSWIMTIFMLACAIGTVPVPAQDWLEYGTLFSVKSPVAVNISDGDIKNLEFLNKLHIYTNFAKNQQLPVWLPDGKNIVFWAPDGIFIAPVEGGVARLVYARYLDTEFGKFAVSARPNRINVTPDGNELIFDQPTSDNVTITRDNLGYFQLSWAGSTFEIVGVSLETGEVRVIVDGGKNPSVSHNGRYICYLHDDVRSRMEGQTPEHQGVPMIYDMETGESWYLTDEKVSVFDEGLQYVFPTFSSDDSHIIVDISDLTTLETQLYTRVAQLYSIPLKGGDPVQLTFWEGNPLVGKELSYPRYSPDGTWILYADFSRYKSENGNYTGPLGLCLYNVLTKETFSIFNSRQYLTMDGRWSPDGTKICYTVSDRNDEFHIYIKEIVPGNLTKLSGNPSQAESQVPSDFDICGVYPNPFNPSTTIEFSLHTAGSADLVIYSITGQKIRGLSAGHITAGVHSIVWDSRDDNGLQVSAGVYMVRLTMGDMWKTEKMLLVK